MWHTMLPIAALAAVVSGIPCEEARLKCAYRKGCGTALQNYLVGCSGVLQSPEEALYCPQVCEYSLIALVSTEEGKALMECDCSDPYCEDQKQRTDVCKPQVLKTINEPVVPCRIAQWICNADAQCSMAFEYYQRYCKAMFHGKKCTPKCHNSISILRRQEKAQKLKMCYCDGSEDYDCHTIQRNMDKLCFNNVHHHYNVTRPKVQLDNNEVIVTSSCSTISVSFVIVLGSLLVFWTL
ncbi:unnamed protein product [Ceutorhynchus assimilis]|uniref:GDNF/GAS1 domain-containing protein n=1 Tax=Ceutorhynchus assimilis TaxID=467358 RepID=A0A9N9MN44_9CUCU|nr:unnamed protein product [Ceutorhynchus assimilis]